VRSKDRNRLRFVEFSSENDPLVRLPDTRQVRYLRRYLTDLGSSVVLIEPRYFDRDYLAEFSAYHSRSARAYSNVCQRVHFFALDRDVDASAAQALLEGACDGHTEPYELLQSAYRGFCIVRPIAQASLGRTVVAWYPDDETRPPRVTASREYVCHVAGLPFAIDRGLAWQQQDEAVSACATVALWTMLQSSAFGPHHWIPTTAEITQMAHRGGAAGVRLFPSAGFRVREICDVISQCRLAPIVIEGDRDDGFTRARFAKTCATLIRSGYPVLLSGHLEHSSQSGHLICATGFRAAALPQLEPGTAMLFDESIAYVYVHDDNLGPNVRFEILDDDGVSAVRLKPSAPTRRPRYPADLKDPVGEYESFVPTELITAVHEDMRANPLKLNEVATSTAEILAEASHLGIAATTRFMPLAEYLGSEIAGTVDPHQKTLAKLRRALTEADQAMSLHLGVARLASGRARLLDVLYDTTGTASQLAVFVSVAYREDISRVCGSLAESGYPEFASIVAAHGRAPRVR
jgi:hypothetical protein